MPSADPDTTCGLCGHRGAHRRADRPGSDGPPFCEECDRCWADRQNRERPPHHG